MPAPAEQAIITAKTSKKNPRRFNIFAQTSCVHFFTFGEFDQPFSHVRLDDRL